jgi:hypothetical protein
MPPLTSKEQQLGGRGKRPCQKALAKGKLLAIKDKESEEEEPTSRSRKAFWQRQN